MADRLDSELVMIRIAAGRERGGPREDDGLETAKNRHEFGHED